MTAIFAKYTLLIMLNQISGDEIKPQLYKITGRYTWKMRWIMYTVIISIHYIITISNMAWKPFPDISRPFPILPLENSILQIKRTKLNIPHHPVKYITACACMAFIVAWRMNAISQKSGVFACSSVFSLSRSPLICARVNNVCIFVRVFVWFMCVQ